MAWLLAILLMGATRSVYAGGLSAELLEPLPAHNLYPPMLRFYDPLPSSAFNPYEASLGIDLVQSYSSIFQYDSLPDETSLLADMEVYSLELVLTRAVSSRTEVGVTLPLHYAHDGFMDAFLRDYHGALGLPNSGRDLRPDDSFAYFYDDPAGGESWTGREGWEPGDLAVDLRHQLHSGADWAAALLGGVTLPTASRERGWGTGQANMAVGAVVSWLARRWFGHVEGHLVHPFADGSETTGYRDYARLSTTLGYRLGARWALLAQVQGGSSPYATGIEQLDQDPWLVAFGGRWALGEQTALSIAFTEGITQQTSPDFTLTVGLEFHP